MIRRMSCSITSRPTSNASLIAASAPTSSSDSPSSSPAAGSSSRRKSGRAASARAIASSRCLAVGQARRPARRRGARGRTRSRIAQLSARACRRDAPVETAAASTFSKTVRRREQPHVLERAHDAGARDLGGLPGRDVLAAQHDAAARRALEPGEHVHERRLAGAVGADQAEDPPSLQRQIDAVDGLHAADVNPDRPAPRGIRRRERLSRAQRHFEAGHAASLARSASITCVARHPCSRFVRMRVDEGTLLLLVIAAVSAETGPIA